MVIYQFRELNAGLVREVPRMEDKKEFHLGHYHPHCSLTLFPVLDLFTRLPYNVLVKKVYFHSLNSYIRNLIYLFRDLFRDLAIYLRKRDRGRVEGVGRESPNQTLC